MGTPKPEKTEKKKEEIEGTEKETEPTADAGPETKKEAGDVAEDTASEKMPDPNGGSAASPRLQELPTEVRVKLRKLDRIEVKYGELLKAYKLAHSRIQPIEVFEAALRENTPLTGINDPGALVEYLNQMTLKSDMIVEELKRVTSDRDDYKKKFEASEEEGAKLRDEISDLRRASVSVIQPDVPDSEKQIPSTPPTTSLANDDAPVKETPEPESTPKSPTTASSRIGGFSLFSPRSKAVSPPPTETSDDLFSFESEHTKLESELHERQTEVEDLRKQVNGLKGDLKVARESTESMVDSLETATRELHALRDAKDKFDETKRDLQSKIDALETTTTSTHKSAGELEQAIEILRVERDEASTRQEELANRVRELEANNSQLKAQIESSSKEANALNEKLSQRDSIVKDLEDTLATYTSAEKTGPTPEHDDEASKRVLRNLQKILSTLDSELNNAKTTIADLEAELRDNKEDYASRPSTQVFGFLDETARSKSDALSSREDVVRFLSDNFGLQTAPSTKAVSESVVPSPAPSEAATSAFKKKNKKKKKGKGQSTTADNTGASLPVKVSENLAEVEETGGDDKEDKDPVVDVSRLEQEIASLQAELSSKNDAVERLSKQLKDQEDLREEIETLRDDLLHQGEEHVEARDALKEAQVQKQTLQDAVDALETELVKARMAADTSADAEKIHREVAEQFDDLKLRCSSLEKDLAASEQLAAGRFKDITDLKELLSKTQPELRNLRNEVAELKSVKEQLKNKAGDLNRLEARHEDIKAELKGLSKRLGDKDGEIKDLQQKIEQETSTRSRLEKDMDKAQMDVRTAESRGQEATASSEQLAKDLARATEESATLKTKFRELEEQISAHARQVSSFREEISLKTALHSSSQSLVQSLRDQTHELNMQAREATTRADSLEEELSETQRMLSERTREGQTMRMLLDQSETGTESRIREMRERMEAAIEERDRVEDEASVNNRRMMREVEEAKSKARDAQRALKVLEAEKEELELRLRDWKRRRDDLEQAATRASKEVEEVRSAMTGLREALDESERQVRELDAAKMDLRRTADDAKDRVEKLTKANKNLTEEVKAAQTGLKGLRVASRPGTGVDSGIPSSRTSIDSASARSPVPKERVLSTTISRSETPTAPGLSQGTVDYVYLKNVLLQFLEQKDKGHQRQLIPVLGMLLHFDR